MGVPETPDSKFSGLGLPLSADRGEEEKRSSAGWFNAGAAMEDKMSSACQCVIRAPTPTAPQQRRRGAALTSLSPTRSE